MKKFRVILMMLLLAPLFLCAQILNTRQLTKRITQYSKNEWEINLRETWNNPYLQEDIALNMLLTTPSGKKLVLPCYFEAGKSGESSLWKARFAPQEAGKYTYIFKLNKAQKESARSKSGSFISATSLSNGFLHPKSNWVLQYDSGKPFRGLGENIGWESRASDDSKFFKELHEQSKYNYEYMLPSLAKQGGNFFRTWVSAFNLPVDWQKPHNSNRYKETDQYFNPSAVAKMDRLVSLSDSLGVYMMLTLGQGAYNVRDGGFSPTAADFFVNPQSKQRYKNRLRYFIARWGYSTSIAAWELFNEVDNVQFSNKSNPINADSIVIWHDEMSTYIKQNDPYRHIVTTSISHRDLKGLNSLANIDINQKHIYKNTAAIPAEIIKYENEFKKPYVIGEYGFEWDWSKNFDDFSEGMDSDFKRGMWYGLFSPTPILPMSWWWEYFDNRKTDTYFSRIKTVSGQMLAAGKGNFTPVTINASVKTIKTYGVKCGDKIFVYAFNPEGADQKVDFTIESQPKSKFTVVAFDCETGNYKNISSNNIDNQKITGWNQPQKSDVVFIISLATK